jgi:IS5 family transposase
MAISYKRQHTMDFRGIRQTLDRQDRVVQLAERIDWERLHDKLAPYFSRLGRQALPIRLMAGLHLLKHLHNTSDERAVEELRSNNYWMYFCDVLLDEAGGKYVRHLCPASMSHFRKRLGPDGMARLEQVLREQIVGERIASGQVLVMDSTAMPKNVTYPTDSELAYRGRRRLLEGMRRIAKVTGLALPRNLRSFRRKARQVRAWLHKLGPGRAERIRQGTVELARQARHVLRKTECYLESIRHLREIHLGKSTHKEVLRLRHTTRLVRKVLTQVRDRFRGVHNPRKVYSLHEPQVTCIRTGKRREPDTYGSKVHLAMDKHGFLLAHQETTVNRSDVKFIEPCLRSWQAATGQLPKMVAADRGYHTPKRSRRGQQIPRWSVPFKGKRPHPDERRRWFRRGQSLRVQLEGAIGHLKGDHRMGRCYYRGFEGDRINVSLAVCAWNLKKWVRLSPMAIE